MGQDDRHGLRRNDGVGLSRHKTEQLLIALNRRALGAAHAAPARANRYGLRACIEQGDGYPASSRRSGTRSYNQRGRAGSSRNSG
jgi:hypothetical protein